MSCKILIRGVNWIGDAVMTMPAIKALSDAFVDYETALLVNSRVLPLFRHDPNVTSLVEYKDSHRDIMGRVKLANSLKADNYALAILLQNAFDAAIIAFLAGIRERVGYDRDARGFLLTKGIPVKAETLRIHQIRYYLNIVDRLGIDAPYNLPWTYLLHEERLQARETLSALRHPIIGINPGASFGSAKRWPTHHFAEVIRGVITQIGGSVVLFGAADEWSLAQQITEALGDTGGASEADFLTADTFLNLCGKTTLRQLAACISECDLLVTNDSGPMHIAYSVGTPLVAIFGSTDPQLTGPPQCSGKLHFAFRSAVIRKKLPCAPCFKRTCKKADIKCMNSITPDEVLTELKALLPNKRAVFFDRDGTLCRDANYLNRFEDLDVYPETEGLKGLKSKGYMMIGISNQSGIARGLIKNEFAEAVNKTFCDNYGFDDFYYCPHHPDSHCPCRKPSPGMLYKARAEHGIDLKRSFFVGDSNADMLVAQAVGASPIFLLNKKHSLAVDGIKTITNLDLLHDMIK
ncbi:ADP-heptose--LPS heptosyltransferase II [Candidatus Magnetobacterium bavaricum]|uniref:lipopolysaccharide heptosyltransferase II n=1 Tax=Candidatus Magnetobacterium bavaricum TaxID=29290 RepID=A0A0F3GKL0_9BACT|nr:ADP-heptose--LPS heptosyltransferase II [Candidatus Magnetobacterium bavaricum]